MYPIRMFKEALEWIFPMGSNTESVVDIWESKVIRRWLLTEFRRFSWREKGKRKKLIYNPQVIHTLHVRNGVIIEFVNARFEILEIVWRGNTSGQQIPQSRCYGYKWTNEQGIFVLIETDSGTMWIVRTLVWRSLEVSCQEELRGV